MDVKTLFYGFMLNLLFQSSFGQTSEDKKCGGVFTATTGEITSPNYPDVYDYDKYCEWRIEAPAGHVVQLTFLDFDVEGIDTTDCDTDEVHIRDGKDSSSPLLGNVLCGEVIPQIVTSSGRYLFISLYSDFVSRGGRGFKASYVSRPADGNESCLSNLCGGTFDGAESCQIQSPSYPSGYDANLNCSWLIKAPSALHKISFEFFDIQLENVNSECAKNNVSLYDGLDARAPLLSESVCDLSSNRLKGKIMKSTGPQLYVRFLTSSSSKMNHGFSAKFTAVLEKDEDSSRTTKLSMKKSPTTTGLISKIAATSSSLISKISSTSTRATQNNIKKTPANEYTTQANPVNDIVNDPAVMSGLVIGVIVALVIVVFGILLVVAFVHWKRQNARFNIRLREEDARSDINTLISSNDSREFDDFKNGKIVRVSESEILYEL